ncbi:MAG TPA: aspartate kinase [Thermotogota bacterium]|nr:aspartate kinase [Thermotogota bacterium]HPJ88351.1 aspartate kinase [Thermotogota bacterium]HPR95481.1 aspartate kinase [Thermotogota bacterium]
MVKFGGSNLKKRDDISKLVKVIHEYEKPLIVVISALYGVTNTIISTVEQAHKNFDSIELLKDQLYKAHRDMLSDYLSDEMEKQTAFEELERRIDEMKRFLLGIHYIGEAPDFVRDTVLSYGERLSAFTLSIILKKLGIDAQEATPEAMGLITDGEFGNATVNFEKSSKQVADYFSEEKVYIVPGFYGISEAGKVNLFGRGGSDYSAAAIAGCVHAQSLDLWKDVEGFLSADPRVVEDAWSIKKMSYLEAAELSYFGAKIIHPRAFEPLMEKDIPLNLFNIDGKLDEIKPVTVITSNSIRTKYVVKSVSHTDNFGILKLKGPGVGVKPGILADATNALKREGINIKSVLTSQTIISILLSSDDLYRAYTLMKHLRIMGVEDINLVDDVSLIAIVGDGINETPGIAAKLFNALSRENINVNMVSIGISEVASYFIVTASERDRAVKSIHKEFFNENSKRNK